MTDSGAIIGQTMRHVVGDEPFFVAYIKDGRLRFVSNIRPAEHQNFLKDCLRAARTQPGETVIHEYKEPS